MTNTQLFFRGVRNSKFRHVYGQPAKRERCYDNINITKNAHDSRFCDVNPKFIAIVTEVAGGGAFIVLPIEKTGRVDFSAYKVAGHTGPVLDVKWNPFNDYILASCSDDCTVKIWQIPEGGLNNHLREPIADLVGHKRRIGYIEWHPSAMDVLASAGFDCLIIIWNVAKAEAINVIDCHPDIIYSMSFNRDGSRLATTCKDKKLRVIDPRSGMVTGEGVCHQGSRCSKVVYLNGGKLATVGFSKHSDRQLCIWNEQNLSSYLTSEVIDSSSGVVFPYFDFDTNILFLAGKGDGNIRYYEIVENHPYVHFLNQYLSGLPQKSLGFMPKRGCDVSICEIFRFYKLHSTKAVCEPVSMIVPRKSGQFQDDLYPDTAAPFSTLTADEWAKGVNQPPQLMSMKNNNYNLNGINGQKLTNSKSRSSIDSLLLPNTFQMKLEFINKPTIPDYRPLETELMMGSEKSHGASLLKARLGCHIQKIQQALQIDFIGKAYSMTKVNGNGNGDLGTLAIEDTSQEANVDYKTEMENEKNLNRTVYKPKMGSNIQKIQQKFEQRFNCNNETDEKNGKLTNFELDETSKIDYQAEYRRVCDELRLLKKKIMEKDQLIVEKDQLLVEKSQRIKELEAIASQVA